MEHRFYSSLKENPEDVPQELNTPIQSSSQKIFHIAYLACLIQLSMIYFYNHINKTGSMWSDGTAIHYMYQLDTFLTPIGQWISATISLGIIKFLTLTTPAD